MDKLTKILFVIIGVLILAFITSGVVFYISSNNEKKQLEEKIFQLQEEKLKEIRGLEKTYKKEITIIQDENEKFKNYIDSTHGRDELQKLLTELYGFNAK